MLRFSSRSSLPLKALIASATVAPSCSETYSVFIMPPAESSSEFEEFADFGLGGGVHFLEDLFAGFLFELGEDVGGLVGRHFLDDIGGLLGFERFQDAGLHFGVFDFGKGVGGGFAVDGFEDGFALGGAEFLDDIGEVGGVHLLEHRVGDVEAQAAQRVGLDYVGKLPGDGVGRNAALQAADPA